MTFNVIFFLLYINGLPPTNINPKGEREGHNEAAKTESVESDTENDLNDEKTE